MKAVWYVGGAIAVVGMLGAIALAGNTPSVAPVMARRVAAIASRHLEQSKDPIIQGSASQLVTGGSNAFFIAISQTLDISKCNEVEVSQVDGNAFDPDNSGKLTLHGMDVGAVFFDINNVVIPPNMTLGASAVNAPVFAGGYSLTSPSSTEFAVLDIAPFFVKNMAVLIEGDVTNTDSKNHTLNSVVTGIIVKEGGFGCN